MPQMYAWLVLVIGNRTKDISPISATTNKIYVGNKTRKYLNVTRSSEVAIAQWVRIWSSAGW